MSLIFHNKIRGRPNLMMSLRANCKGLTTLVTRRGQKERKKKHLQFKSLICILLYVFHYFHQRYISRKAYGTQSDWQQSNIHHISNVSQRYIIGGGDG